MKAIEQLKDFIQRTIENKSYFGMTEWLYGTDLDVYVRKSEPRNIDNQKQVTLDIANIIVHNRGKGNFTRFLSEVEKISPWPIYVENVLEERFANFLVRRGYTKYNETNSYYKIK